MYCMISLTISGRSKMKDEGQNTCCSYNKFFICDLWISMYFALYARFTQKNRVPYIVEVFASEYISNTDHYRWEKG